MSRTPRAERGATAVEAALVTPVILLFVFGILEFGLFFKDALSASDATKSGVRIASAHPRTTSYAQDAADRVQEASAALARRDIEQLWVYKANPENNFPAGYSDFSGCTQCVRFRWTGSSFVPTSSGWPAATQRACASGTIDRVGVYLQLRHNAVTGLAFDTLTIRQADVLAFEPVPASRGCGP